MEEVMEVVMEVVMEEGSASLSMMEVHHRSIIMIYVVYINHLLSKEMEPVQ